MKILIACEESQTVCKEMRRRYEARLDEVEE